ncbi:hypothetical protein [Sulfitobacter sp. PS-8MA]|uniref:hypothetical protein n=1 Tax=Sulfitobacter sp. PS-8MA TaxID=3237707 RepID=UPI0034C63738
MSQKENSPPEEIDRHRQIFDLLRDAERGAQTAKRIAQPQHPTLTEDMARKLQQRAHASLRQQTPPPRTVATYLRRLFKPR